MEDLKQETNRFFFCRGCHPLGCWGVTFRDDPSRSTKLVAVGGRGKFGVKIVALCYHFEFFQVLRIVGSCTFAVIYMMLVFLGKGIHLTWQVTSRKTPGGQVLRLDNFRGTSRFQMNLKLSISSFKVWKTRFFFPIFRDENKKQDFDLLRKLRNN